MELEEFYYSEPFGEFREEIRHGQKMALTQNLKRDPKMKPTPFTTLECMNFVDVVKAKPVVESPDVISARISSELFGMRG